VKRNGLGIAGDVDFVFFDLAGTTVDDGTQGDSLVVSAMIKAFVHMGLLLEAEDVILHRGKEKREIIQLLIADRCNEGKKVPEDTAAKVYEYFLDRLRRGTGSLREIEGTEKTFRFLKSRGIRIGVGSGFPTEIVDRIVAHMGWAKKGLLDYTASAEQIGVGRPDPGMIYHAMKRLTITDPGRVLKVGDTVADVEEGKNAGTRAAVVLTGTQPKDILRTAGADFVLRSVAEIPRLFD
jgi:phosphonatase-like hydrolase